jgi:hypothetical protein
MQQYQQQQQGSPQQQQYQQQQSAFLTQDYDDQPMQGAGLYSRTRKPALPNFDEMRIIEHGRRSGQAVERKTGAVDHPCMGNYDQHTFNEYKRDKEQYAKQRFGGLGRDDNPEKEKAREKKRQIFAYGNAVNAINFAFVEEEKLRDLHKIQARPIGRELSLEAEVALAKRHRAKEYADHYRPRVLSPSTKRRLRNSQTPQPTGDAGAGVEQELSDLAEKHRSDQAAIARIKAQLNIGTT